MRTYSWFRALFVALALVIPYTASAQTLAEGGNFTTPYLTGATAVAINGEYVPSKLYAQPVFGGYISNIFPAANTTHNAYYLARGNVLYVTGHTPGYMYFYVEETLSNGRKILSQPILFTFYTLRVTTPETCQGYDRSSHFAAVSPVSPLRLNIATNPAGITPQFHVGLLDPSLGKVKGPNPTTYGQEITVEYTNSGSSKLEIWQLSPQNTPLVLYSLPLDFLAEKEVNLNLFFVHDAKGYAPKKLNQRDMTGYVQDAEKILNQAGIHINVAYQEELYVPESLGHTIEAYSEGMSPEENAVIAQAESEKEQGKFARHRDKPKKVGTINIFLVWDYSIEGQATVGVTYDSGSLGKVIFVGDKTYKPGETLAHEIGHALGLRHNNLGQSFLMSANEGKGDQCSLARSEWNTMNANA